MEADEEEKHRPWTSVARPSASAVAPSSIALEINGPPPQAPLTAAPSLHSDGPGSLPDALDSAEGIWSENEPAQKRGINGYAGLEDVDASDSDEEAGLDPEGKRQRKAGRERHASLDERIAPGSAQALVDARKLADLEERVAALAADRLAMA